MHRKSPLLTHPTSFWRPVGVIQLEIHRGFDTKLNGVVCVILDSAIFVELRLVTYRQTNGHTMTAYTVLA